MIDFTASNCSKSHIVTHVTAFHIDARYRFKNGKDLLGIFDEREGD